MFGPSAENKSETAFEIESAELDLRDFRMREARRHDRQTETSRDHFEHALIIVRPERKMRPHPAVGEEPAGLSQYLTMPAHDHGFVREIFARDLVQMGYRMVGGKHHRIPLAQ